jgi:hypothetical protein
MHHLPLVIFLTLAAGANRPIPEGCREDHGTCREDCTIDYGGSTTKYRQLTACIVRCDKEQKECTSRHYSLQDAQIDLDPAQQRTPDPAMREPDTVPASGTEAPRDSVRRGVYRASEAEPPAPTEPAEPPAAVEPPAPAAKEPPVAAPAPAPEPKAQPQPAAPVKPAAEPASKKDSDDVRIFDDPEPEPAPAPKPAPKPVEPTRSQPPPEPKKKDISEWDPNGD